MKTIKELDKMPPLMEAGYQLCKKDVLGLIDTRIIKNKGQYKRALEELKARIIG